MAIFHKLLMPVKGNLRREDLPEFFNCYRCQTYPYYRRPTPQEIFASISFFAEMLKGESIRSQFKTAFLEFPRSMQTLLLHGMIYGKRSLLSVDGSIEKPSISVKNDLIELNPLRTGSCDAKATLGRFNFRSSSAAHLTFRRWLEDYQKDNPEAYAYGLNQMPRLATFVKFADQAERNSDDFDESFGRNESYRSATFHLSQDRLDLSFNFSSSLLGGDYCLHIKNEFVRYLNTRNWYAGIGAQSTSGDDGDFLDSKD